MKKIIEEPGQFYFVDQRLRKNGTNCHWIVRYGGNKDADHWIRLHEVKRRDFRSAYDSGDFGIPSSIDKDEVRLATADEKIWLQACIDKGEFVHKSEVLPSVIELDIF